MSTGISSSQVFIERVEEHDSALRDLDLLDSGESTTTLSFRDLQSRIEKLLSNERGLLTLLVNPSQYVVSAELSRRIITSNYKNLMLSADECAYLSICH